MWRICQIACLVVVGLLGAQAKKLTEANLENCQVCVTFVGQFIESLDDPSSSKPAEVEDAFRKFCKHSKKDNNRFCYYVGGLVESATGMLGELSKPITWGVPAEKVCMKLYRKDAQICDIRYELTVDFATVNLKKLKVKDLKSILSDWDEVCRGCTEKSDYIKLIEDLMPKYEKKAWEARQKAEL